jgi:peptidoglycan-N-acetylglucosamine deacetylase
LHELRGGCPLLGVLEERINVNRHALRVIAFVLVAVTVSHWASPPVSAAPLADDCQPTSRIWEPTPGRAITVDRGLPSCNTVSLTFDAGADRGYAEQILDILRDTGVKASFGMTGLWAQQNSDLIVRMANEGHEFINHSWRHGSFTGFSTNSRPLSVDVRASELERTEELIKSLTGRSTLPMFRPPYGDYNDGVLRDVSDQGYDYSIMWTVDSRGWMHYPASRIVDLCLNAAQPGAIYLFHVGIESEDAFALSPIIEGPRDRGLRAVMMSEMLGLKPQVQTPAPVDPVPAEDAQPAS